MQAPSNAGTHRIQSAKFLQVVSFLFHSFNPAVRASRSKKVERKRVFRGVRESPSDAQRPTYLQVVSMLFHNNDSAIYASRHHKLSN